MVVTNTIVTRPSSNNILDHVVADAVIIDISSLCSTLKLPRLPKCIPKLLLTTDDWTNSFKSYLNSCDFRTLSPNHRTVAITENYTNLRRIHSSSRSVKARIRNSCCPWFNLEIWELSKASRILQKKGNAIIRISN